MLKTTELESLIERTPEQDLKKMLEEIPNLCFVDYINKLMEEKGLEKAYVIQQSQIPRTYAYQILQGNRQASRDKVLQLALAMKLNKEESDRLLTVAGHNKLYAKKKRDAVFLFSLLHHHDVTYTNELLNEHDQKLLGE